MFVNLFWNGIVSVFVLQLLGAGPNGIAPLGAEWWGLFFFLIPFEAIGLAMFVALLAALLEPVRRTVWTFSRQSIVCRWTWLGAGRTWNWPVEQLARLEIRRDDPSVKKTFRASLKFSASTEGDGAEYRLLMVGPEESELCSIDGLTEGEALWMGDTLLRQRKEWFPATR